MKKNWMKLGITADLKCLDALAFDGSTKALH
jgi:hypothetical protein